MENVALHEMRSVLPYLMKYQNIWSDYDKEADTLYLHFKKPNHANHSEMTDDEIIIRYEKDEIIGFTILNASKRQYKNKPKYDLLLYFAASILKHEHLLTKFLYS
jgi:uncharacterized protein YuzE